MFACTKKMQASPPPIYKSTVNREKIENNNPNPNLNKTRLRSHSHKIGHKN